MDTIAMDERGNAQGSPRSAALAAVQPEPAHGYAIAERLSARSDGAFDLSEGTLYPALHRLERAGLLASRWSDVNGRRRRVYRLTQQGQRALARQHGEWREFARAVHAVEGLA
jgi:DNA-binding PadR family transcriptional regulator